LVLLTWPVPFAVANTSTVACSVADLAGFLHVEWWKYAANGTGISVMIWQGCKR
jgi:hypothetical protein